jgi:hypothetical protein
VVISSVVTSRPLLSVAPIAPMMSTANTPTTISTAATPRQSTGPRIEVSGR